MRDDLEEIIMNDPRFEVHDKNQYKMDDKKTKNKKHKIKMKEFAEIIKKFNMWK